MDTGKSSLERLVDAGILEVEGLSEEEKEAINRLTEEEIQALITIKEKLTVFSWPIRTRMF